MNTLTYLQIESCTLNCRTKRIVGTLLSTLALKITLDDNVPKNANRLIHLLERSNAKRVEETFFVVELN